tara:strand:- start:1647 stop:1874 length:228 start_codon:yes stop_codon:yes gene_type:complete
MQLKIITICILRKLDYITSMKNNIIIILLVGNLVLTVGLIFFNFNSLSAINERTTVMEALLYDLDEDIHELEKDH